MTLVSVKCAGPRCPFRRHTSCTGSPARMRAVLDQRCCLVLRLFYGSVVHAWCRSAGGRSSGRVRSQKQCTPDSGLISTVHIFVQAAYVRALDSPFFCYKSARAKVAALSVIMSITGPRETLHDYRETLHDYRETHDCRELLPLSPHFFFI